MKSRMVLGMILLCLGGFGLLGCSSSEDPDEEIIEILHESETISAAETWSGHHRIEGFLQINARLDIEPCTVIRLGAGARINVTDGGALVAIGEPDCPIRFTSAKAVPAAGDWDGVGIDSSASNESAFDYVEVEYAGGDYGALWLNQDASMEVDHTRFADIQTYALDMESGARLGSFVDNAFVRIDDYLIRTYPNDVWQLEAFSVSDNLIERVLVRNGDSSEAQTWPNLGVPYVIEYITVVGETLSVEAGATLLFDDGALIEVFDEGGLVLAGTSSAPIVLESAKGAPAAGDWLGLWFFGTANNDNELDHVFLRHSGGGDYGAVWMASEATVHIQNTSFEDCENAAIDMDEGADLASFANNSFTGIQVQPIMLSAQEVGDLSAVTTADNPENRVLVRGGTTTTAQSWKNIGLPYECESMEVTGGTLEVEAGITLLMAPDALISVYDSGALMLSGTEDEPVLIESVKSAPAARDWGGIWFYGTSSNDNDFTYATIRHAGGGDYGQVWLDDGVTLVLDHVVFEEGSGCDVYLGDPPQPDGDGTSVVDAEASDFSTCF